MKYCVNTDWVVDYLKGREPIVTLLDQLGDDGLAISVIMFGEVYEGIHYGRDPSAAEAAFRHFLRRARTLPITRLIARRFAVIRGEVTVNQPGKVAAEVLRPR